MVYTEWLRIRNILRGYAYVLLALFILAVVIRVCVNGQFDIDQYKAEANDPGAHVTTQTLAGGIVETTIVNPSKHHKIVIDDAGWHGKRITVTTTGLGQGTEHDSTHMLGALSVSSNTQNGTSTTVVDTEMPSINLGWLFLIGLFPGLIIATCFGAPLARENAEHLEVAFTRPVSRLTLASNIVLADVIAIIASFVMTAIAMILCIAVFQLPALTLDADGVWFIAISILAAVAWYGMYLGVSSSFKRGRGVVLGLAWPIGLIILPPMAVVPLGSSALGQVAHALFNTLARLDPIAYINATFQDHQMMSNIPIGIFGYSYGGTVVALAVLAIVYIAAGLAQWQRVEA